MQVMEDILQDPAITNGEKQYLLKQYLTLDVGSFNGQKTLATTETIMLSAYSYFSTLQPWLYFKKTNHVEMQLQLIH